MFLSQCEDIAEIVFSKVYTEININTHVLANAMDPINIKQCNQAFLEEAPEVMLQKRIYVLSTALHLLWQRKYGMHNLSEVYSAPLPVQNQLNL